MSYNYRRLGIAPYSTFAVSGETTLSGGTLSADVHGDKVIITGTVNCAGYRIFARSWIRFDGGSVNRIGNSGLNPSGGGALASATLGGATSGGNGGLTTGLNAAAFGNALGGSGGAGGGNIFAGGAGGVASTPNTTSGTSSIFRYPPSLFGWTNVQAANTRVGGGAGGGGGSGDGFTQGAGGGSGGGVVLLMAPYIFGTGSVSVAGGKGADATGTDLGGGGGGGGGLIRVICDELDETNLTFSVAGGAGGLGSGIFGIGDGSPGSNGLFIKIEFNRLMSL